MKKLMLFATLFLFMAGCTDDDPQEMCSVAPGQDAVIFEFYHDSTGDTFLAWTSRSSVIENVRSQLALPMEDRLQHINGKILRLPEGCEANQQWSWYFDPNNWDMADLSIELCDGNPSYVEENLAEYVDVVGSFCPWGSQVLREVHP